MIESFIHSDYQIPEITRKLTLVQIRLEFDETGNVAQVIGDFNFPPEDALFVVGVRLDGQQPDREALEPVIAKLESALSKRLVPNSEK